ncbi:MAG: hypothetical protein FJW96_17055 [Actinobacteria bacterium]|nr:hypothetical protein [Actinomycetota bacterium]
MQRAERLARETPLLLVVGSSLQGWPVAGLPAMTVRAGGRVVVVNRDPTPADDDAILVLRGPAGESLRAAADLLLGAGGAM